MGYAQELSETPTPSVPVLGGGLLQRWRFVSENLHLELEAISQTVPNCAGEKTRGSNF
jgi:hypothetical protein